MNRFASFPLVNSEDLEALRALKQDYPIKRHSVCPPSPIKQQGVQRNCGLRHDPKEMFLRAGKFDPSSFRLLQRIARQKALPIWQIPVHDLSEIHTEAHRQRDGIGPKSVKMLKRLKTDIANALQSCNCHLIENNDSLITWGKPRSVELSQLENLLIADTESYLLRLQPMFLEIALKRWGYTVSSATLSELGGAFAISRERIRQLEKSINEELICWLRIHPQVLKHNLENLNFHNLDKLLPTLSKCFSDKNNLISFLEICTGLNAGTFAATLPPEVDDNWIEELFSSLPSPTTVSFMRNELTSAFRMSAKQADAAIARLSDLQRLRVENGMVWPINMSQTRAIAHVLSMHPKGLPWKDAVLICNTNKFSITPLRANRINPAIATSELIHLCGKGTYRHNMHLPVSETEFDTILKEIAEALGTENTKALQLYAYWRNSPGRERHVDYYSLRHIVKRFGYKAGIEFIGKSSADTVSFNRASAQINQVQTILHTLEKSEKAMTPFELAEHIRSKNELLVCQHLADLEEAGTVVKVGARLWTTSEIAFKGVDQAAIVSRMASIAKAESRIIEVDVFREILNKELNQNYSKYFYSSLLKRHLQHTGLHIRRTFISTKPIPYDGLKDAFRHFSKGCLTTKQVVEALRQCICMTENIATRFSYNYRISAE